MVGLQPLGDTIFALSSGRLPSGVAVIRLSGPQTRFALEAIAGVLPRQRRAELRLFRARDGAVLDAGLALFFPSPHSFTGEDCGEFQVHGGRAVVQAVLSELGAITGLRHAEAGEFTLRAFLNGKMDLTAAEALADLVSAETEAQRRFAIGNARGAQGVMYEGWRTRLLHARAMIEAELDFSDEGDVPGSVSEGIWKDMAGLEQELEDHVRSFSRAEMIRDGVRVVILGAPNAGKSSLLNALAQRDVAIVSEEPGTTRDLLDVALDLDGFKVLVTDTAGIRVGSGKVETMGIERALARAADADLVLYLEDMADPVAVNNERLNVPALRVGTKLDMYADNEGACGRYDHRISAKSGAGLDALLADLSGRIARMAGDVGDTLPSRQRHVQLLRQSAIHLRDARNDQEALEVRAEHLRLAGDALGKIVGAIDVEDLLGAIFSEFCVGK
jgi:tRNA modification GTPase